MSEKGFLKECVQNDVIIDFNSEILYGDDQCYLDYPCRFPTVGFKLMATNRLIQIAEHIRKNVGMSPLDSVDKISNDICEYEGCCYEFYVGLNGFSDNHMDSCIEFVVVNSASEDNEKLYTIDLTSKEQDLIYGLLDEQCRRHKNKSCKELLEEAKERVYSL